MLGLMLAVLSILVSHDFDVQDKKLTKEEILQHQDVFVGSRATEWGKYLNRHDEF